MPVWGCEADLSTTQTHVRGQQARSADNKMPVSCMCLKRRCCFAQQLWTWVQQEASTLLVWLRSHMSFERVQQHLSVCTSMRAVVHQ
jgi:hypothetical protein